MIILKKIFSKRAQISLEIGILVAAAVTVATISTYYYISGVKNAAQNAGNSANSTTVTLGGVANSYTQEISKLTS